MTKYLSTLVFLLGLLLLAGCSSRPSSIIASTSPLPPGVRGSIPARGSDCQFHLLGLIPVTTAPDTQNALNRAKRYADVDVLTDVTIDHNSGYYILFSNNCVRVKGMGVARSKLENVSNRAEEVSGGGVSENENYY